MKGYWVCIYEKIDNSEKLKEYALKAKPAIENFSGKFLVRGGRNRTNDKALECYDSKEYQEAHNILNGHVIRHHQTVEGN